MAERFDFALTEFLVMEIEKRDADLHSLLQHLEEFCTAYGPYDILEILASMFQARKKSRDSKLGIGKNEWESMALQIDSLRYFPSGSVKPFPVENTNRNRCAIKSRHRYD